MRLILVFLLFTVSWPLQVNAQDNKIPDWYFKNISDQLGTWVADNAAHKSEHEPFGAYAIEWKWGPLKNSIYGRLYGLIEGEDAGTLWEFHQYWDRLQGKCVVIQFGHNSITGMGFVSPLSEDEFELIQNLAFADGSNIKEKHLLAFPDKQTQITTAFHWEDEQWIQKRTYSWHLQNLE